MRSTLHKDVVTWRADDRPQMLDELVDNPVDVLVVGGGITGAGIALDAVSRGLRTAIIEQDDWGAGTTSKSSKMIHGGLRYLSTGDISIVRESLAERAAIQRNARHMVRPLHMMVPAYGRTSLTLGRLKIGAGLTAYDLLGASKAHSRHTWSSLPKLLRRTTNLAVEADGIPGRLQGAHSYFDAQADDCRLVMAVLRAAVQRGAIAINGLRADSYLEVGARVGGVVASASAEGDTLDASGIELRAGVVVNATGVWSDAIPAPDGHVDFAVLPSKGVHLTVPRDVVGSDVGITFFGQTNNSNYFIEPWQDDLAIVGTSDAPWRGDLRFPTVDDSDIEQLLGTLNRFLRDPIQKRDVLSSWAGLRPLVIDKPDDIDAAGASKDVSRKHLMRSTPGLVTMTGGKLTAYRAMAQDATDEAIKNLRSYSNRSSDDLGPCVTATLALDGCRELPTSGEIAGLCEQMQCDRSTARHLYRRYGTRVDVLRSLVSAQSDLRRQIHPDRPYLAVEVAYAARYEQARTVKDVAERRTRLNLETRQPKLAANTISSLLDAEASAQQNSKFSTR